MVLGMWFWRKVSEHTRVLGGGMEAGLGPGGPAAEGFTRRSLRAFPLACEWEVLGMQFGENTAVDLGSTSEMSSPVHTASRRGSQARKVRT